MTADMIMPVFFSALCFRCYACDDEVPVEPETALHNCIKLILKAMNLSPPPGDFNPFFPQDTNMCGTSLNPN